MSKQEVLDCNTKKHKGGEKIKRGEVYYADLSPVVGSEQGGVRPVLVIQNDVGNNHSPTVIVSPMTTKAKNGLPTHVKISTHCGVREDSVIMLEQIRTIDKTRLRNFICCLPGDVMRNVDKAMEISLALYKEETHLEKEHMMNELQIFNSSEFGEIRTVIENGEPMFCLTDVCRILEIKNVSDCKSRLRKDGVGTAEVMDSFGRKQNATFINEANLYKTIFQSRKESAERFSDWVAGDVLPTLRKTGSYQMKPMSPEEMMRVQLGMIDGHEERISKLENTMNIDYGQQRVLEKEVAKVVIDSLGGKESSAYQEIGKKVFAECNRDVKDYFHVNSRNNIPRLRFEDAVEYIKNWQPCNNTRIAINDANAQMNFGG